MAPSQAHFDAPLPPPLHCLLRRCYAAFANASDEDCRIGRSDGPPPDPSDVSTSAPPSDRPRASSTVDGGGLGRSDGGDGENGGDGKARSLRAHLLAAVERKAQQAN
eukprot:9307228-Pyramimonas_sp.AAC.1